MSHSYTNLLYHIVFATYERQPLIDADLKPRLYDYMGGIVRGLGGVMIEIGGIEDHVHSLVKLKPNIEVSEFLKKFKANSSGWVNRIQKRMRFDWQGGYGAFTVSESQIENVRDYIKNQEAHHRKMSFEEEFKMLLKKHGIEFDEKYLWK